jgi:DNA-binding response OmpR family regulator
VLKWGVEKILIIDDEWQILKLVKARLKAEGYEVATARDGAEGIEMAKEEVPDLILADVMMPRMDGYAMLAKLKTIIGTRGIPVIMYSAKITRQKLQCAMESGAAAYLPKPFTPKDLIGKIKAVLSRP